MSMSIPIFFEPVRFEIPKTGETHLIVDGGMLSNFPVWLFDCDGGPTLADLRDAARRAEAQAARRRRGCRPREPIRRGPRAPHYVKAMAQTMMEAHDRIYIEAADYARTVPIPTLGVGTTEFDISLKRKQELFDSVGRPPRVPGDWDFDAYITAFRSGGADAPGAGARGSCRSRRA